MSLFSARKKKLLKKINDAFERSSKKELKKILEVTHEKLVSIDFNHHSASAIVDASLTNVVGKKWVKFQLGMIMNGAFQTECVI